MHRLLVAYTTYDGHTDEIAERISWALRHTDCAVELCDLARSRPERPLHEYDRVETMGKLTEGSFKVNPVSIITVGDELVVAHVKDTMVLEGNPIEIDAVVVWRIVDGKIVEPWDIPAVHHPHPVRLGA